MNGRYLEIVNKSMSLKYGSAIFDDALGYVWMLHQFRRKAGLEKKE